MFLNLTDTVFHEIWPASVSTSSAAIGKIWGAPTLDGVQNNMRSIVVVLTEGFHANATLDR
jgi:hypothetical protein